MSGKKQELNKTTLAHLYYKEGRTLQEIGDIYGITRERVRQLMERHGIPRVRNRPKHSIHPVYTNLEDYFRAYKSRKEDTPTLRKLLKIAKCVCGECGSVRYLDIHHINYPATSIDDIQVLCKQCHKFKHNQGMTYEKQILLYELYIQGSRWEDLAKLFGVSKSLVYLIIRKIKRGYRTLRH